MHQENWARPCTGASLSAATRSSRRAAAAATCGSTSPTPHPSPTCARVGKLDAVASAAGVTPFKTVQELTADDYTAAFQGKVLAQIELVRQGIHHIAADGSFTLITGVLARSPIVTGAAASMAGGALESFVRAAAIEIAPQRINAISPTVFTEALEVYGDYFPGFPSVGLAEVGQAYVRSIEGKQTGQVYELD